MGASTFVIEHWKQINSPFSRIHPCRWSLAVSSTLHWLFSPGGWNQGGGDNEWSSLIIAHQWGFFPGDTSDGNAWILFKSIPHQGLMIMVLNSCFRRCNNGKYLDVSIITHCGQICVEEVQDPHWKFLYPQFDVRLYKSNTQFWKSFSPQV